jgi:DNA-binding NtrC family response regulator
VPASFQPSNSRGDFCFERDQPLGEGGYEAALERYDRQLLATALAQTGGRIRETARLLGIARHTLKAKMKKYGLEGAG